MKCIAVCKGYLLCAVVFIAISIVGLDAEGQTVPIPNPSFETGQGSPDGWQLSGGLGGWSGEGIDGSRAISISGVANSQTSTYWYTPPLTFEPGACYRFSFQARRTSGTGGSPITGPDFCNRDLHEVTSEWKQYTSYFVAPASGVSCPLRLGQWEAEGIIEFDDVSLVRAEPVYRRHNGIALGDGEHISGDTYTFTAPLTGASANHARPLQGQDCFFNKPRWVFTQGNRVVYRHEINEVMQRSAEIEVSVGYHTGGTLVAEASTDGDNWVRVETLDALGSIHAPLPASLFPANAVFVRFTVMPSENSDAPIHLQIYGYTYNARLEKAPGDFYGATRFIAVPEPDGAVSLAFDDLGEAIPGGKNELRFHAKNLTGDDITIAPRLTISAGDAQKSVNTIAPVALPAAAGDMVPVIVPYDLPCAGDITLSLELGENIVYRAETSFNISCLYESCYGMKLPDSSEDVALWWASSGWKISRNRPAPQETSPAMRICLAQNEREAAQFILKPHAPLHHLHVMPQSLKNTNGDVIPVESIEILRVGYVPVTQPTDSVGTVAPWPDPLPPFIEPLELKQDENQPFWVCIHTTKDTAPGIYSGTILLEADRWKANVPLEVEIFDFTLPDRKTCTSAFGFDASLAFRYHNAKSETDKRVVYEKYLSILRDHHISIYNPTALDPIKYDWPHLPKWKGGERDSKNEGNVLVLRDASATENVATLYDQLMPIPEKALKVQFDYKTETPGHKFLLTILHYDGAGDWLRGRNNDVAIEGDGSWQHFNQEINAFPEGATQFMIRIWATHYSEAGNATGTVWIDNVDVQDAATGAIMIQDDFEMPDAQLAEIFTPEFDWTAWDAAMTRAFDHYHFNGFSLPVPGLGSGTFHSRQEPSLLGYGEDTPEYKAAFTAWCRTVETHLQEKGWLDDSYVYWFDEPEPPDYEFVMNGFRKLKEAAPGIGRMLTEQIEPELVGGPNIWCPISNCYDYDMARQRQAAGEKIWWYVCTGPKAPYATLFIDHPATELRVWLWQTWERAIDGILIWQTNFWHSDEAYPDVPQNPYEDPMGWTTGYSTPTGAKRPWGNGDGRFIYPPLAAADGQPEMPVFDDPVSSIRLEMLRDGIEDYEYCVILRDLLGKHKERLSAEEIKKYQMLLEVPDTITQSLTEFTWNPAPIETHREAVARAVEVLSKK